MCCLGDIKSRGAKVVVSRCMSLYKPQTRDWATGCCHGCGTLLFNILRAWKKYDPIVIWGPQRRHFNDYTWESVSMNLLLHSQHNTYGNPKPYRKWEEKRGSGFKTGEEKSRMPTPEFLNLAAAVWPRRSHYFLITLTRWSVQTQRDLGLVISTSLAFLPRIAGPIKHRLQSAGKEDWTGRLWGYRDTATTFPTEPAGHLFSGKKGWMCVWEGE